jgi:hypothetical protein
MNSSAKDIREILEEYDESANDSSSLGLNYQDNLFIGREPPYPINCVTIYDTPGMSPYLGLNDVGYEYPSIQVRVRNTKYSDGWSLIEKIKTALHGKNQIPWNGTLYSLIYCTSGPALLEWDDNGNAVFFCNFNLQRRPL